MNIIQTILFIWAGSAVTVGLLFVAPHYVRAFGSFAGDAFRSLKNKLS